MRIHQTTSVVTCMLLCASPLRAQPTSQPASQPTSKPASRPASQTTSHVAEAFLPYTLTVSGGISLGAYEAGLNWAIVRFLKAHDPDVEQPDQSMGATPVCVPRDDRPAWLDPAAGGGGFADKSTRYCQDPQTYVPPTKLVAVSGASAGSINGFLSAIAWSEIPAAESPQDNLFWDTWVNIGLAQLFPLLTTTRCEEYHQLLGLDAAECGAAAQVSETGAEAGLYRSDDGIFSRKAFAQVIEEIEARLARQGAFRAHSGLRVGANVSKSPSVTIEFGDEEKMTARTMRYVVPMQTVVSEAGALRFHSLPPGDYGRLGKVLDLEAGPGQEIDIDEIVGIVQASSAFPVAFGRQKIGASAAAEHYFDGGVFDNVPLGLTVAMANKKHPRAEHIYLHPELMRPRERLDHGGAPSQRGLGALYEFAGDFVTVARDYETQVVARSSPETRLRLTDRYYPIVGETLHAFGAFMLRPFREFDFHVGVYDAHIAIAKRLCTIEQQRTPGAADQERWGEVCLLRRVRELHDTVFALGADDPEARDTSYVVRRLLHREFEHLVEVAPAQPHLAWASAYVEQRQVSELVPIVADAFDGLVEDKPLAPPVPWEVVEKFPDRVRQLPDFKAQLQKKANFVDGTAVQAYQAMQQEAPEQFPLLSEEELRPVAQEQAQQVEQPEREEEPEVECSGLFAAVDKGCRFERLVQHLRAARLSDGETLLMEAIEDCADEELACPLERETLSQAQRAEYRLASRYLANWQGWLLEVSYKALGRARELERLDSNRNIYSALTMSEAVLRVAEEFYGSGEAHNGYFLVPSSRARLSTQHMAASAVGVALPDRAGFDLMHGTIETTWTPLSLRPPQLWTLTPELALGVTPARFMENGAFGWHLLRAGAGLSVGWRALSSERLIFSSIDATWRVMWEPDDRACDAWGLPSSFGRGTYCWTPTETELGFNMLAGKLRLALAVRDWREALYDHSRARWIGLNRRSLALATEQLGLKLAVNDLNGIAYWLVRVSSW